MLLKLIRIVPPYGPNHFGPDYKGIIVNLEQYRPIDAHVKSRFPLFYNVSSYFRKKRIRYFIEELNINGSEKILDIGGEFYFWEQLEFIKDITLINLHKSKENERIKSIEYDGTTLPFDDNTFDIVFSNSTIEHVGDFNKQKLFALEVERVGRKHFIQVPSYWFIFEPHAQIPFFQFLPDSLKKAVITYYNRSTYSVEELVSIRLLKKSEIKSLFPHSKIVTERFCLMPKSYYIIKS